MATEQKTTLLDVRLNLTDAIKEMAEYQQKIDELAVAEKTLQQQIRASGDADGSLRRELVKTREERKAYSKEVGELSRQVQNSIVAENKYQGTLKGLCAELSIAKDRLRAMKMTDPGWEDQRDKVDKLNSEIKDLEQSYGVYSRDVGNHGKATASIGGREMEELTKLTKNLSLVTAALNAVITLSSGTQKNSIVTEKAW